MTKSTILLLSSLTLIYGCGQSPTPEKVSHPAGTPTIDSTNIAAKTAESKESKTRTVSEIVTFIDSLYGIKVPQSVDTITTWTTPAGRKHELGPMALDLTNLDQYYQYLSFQFLLFKDRTAAKRQFDRVAEAGSHKRADLSEANQELYLKIFSKAGSAYTLYGNMIIYHERRCNYNENIEVPREDQLLDFLFDHHPPDSTYFVRVRCGWVQQEIK